MSNVTVYTDGASRGNPGSSAIAYVISHSKDTLEFAENIGITTNNQAEYRAMVAALGKLEELNFPASHVEVFSDSELMIRQITGVYKVKDPAIRPHYEAIRGSISRLEAKGYSFEFTAVRRGANKRADELCNLALDGKLAGA